MSLHDLLDDEGMSLGVLLARFRALESRVEEQAVLLGDFREIVGTLQNDVWKLEAKSARVTESADVPHLECGESNLVGVRIPPLADTFGEFPNKAPGEDGISVPDSPGADLKHDESPNFRPKEMDDFEARGFERATCGKPSVFKKYSSGGPEEPAPCTLRPGHSDGCIAQWMPVIAASCFGIPRATDDESQAYWKTIDAAATATEETAARVQAARLGSVVEVALGIGAALGLGPGSKDEAANYLRAPQAPSVEAPKKRGRKCAECKGEGLVLERSDRSISGDEWKPCPSCAKRAAKKKTVGVPGAPRELGEAAGSGVLVRDILPEAEPTKPPAASASNAKAICKEATANGAPESESVVIPGDLPW